MTGQRVHSSLASLPQPRVLEAIRMRLTQIAEQVGSAGWSSVIKQVVFLNRKAVVVEKELSEIQERPGVLEDFKMQVIDIDRSMLSSGLYRFAVRSRRLKASHYLETGYEGVALVRDGEVIGDTWYIPSKAVDDPRLLHKDLLRFGFKSWPSNHVYTFDIFVAPAERKGKVAPVFQNEAMLRLRAKGYTKAFGFYWADNIPAHWCTRVTNKWKNLRTVNVSRFLMFEWSASGPEK